MAKRYELPDKVWALLLGPEKRGPKEPLDHAMGRSQSGLTTRIHLVCDANDGRLRSTRSPGQAGEQILQQWSHWPAACIIDGKDF